MQTVIAVSVPKTVFGRVLTMIAVRQCMLVWEHCLVLSKSRAHCDCCEAMHACVGVCVFWFAQGVCSWPFL
jgi:hypothetical protein